MLGGGPDQVNAGAGQRAAFHEGRTGTSSSLVVVQFAQKQSLVIPKPGLSARNLLAAGCKTADSSRDNTALRNDNP